MKTSQYIMVAAAIVIGTVGTAAPALAATPKTLTGVQARVDAKAEHITAKMQTLRVRLAAKPYAATAKNTLQADITRVLADTATWRRQVDTATTMTGIRSADPAHQTVKADLAKLHTDLAAAKKTKAPAQ
jgi:L-2-hydroxyglutarate oxidase LhgO